MSTIIITGSAGLVGSACVRYFAERGHIVVGIDNDTRKRLFGEAASTAPMAARLADEVPGYEHVAIDIRDADAVAAVFAERADIVAVIHAAAQPSHDWARNYPQTDLAINAGGTLNLLEATREHCPSAAFVFCSTNKVYGDNPNRLPLREGETRYLCKSLPNGIDESMSLDGCTHSLFGASKLSADVMVQEYGRCFGMNTACFRGGCLTGPAHAGAQQHGFLAYLVQCAVRDVPYEIIGYGGKQVRDNIHAEDVASAFAAYIQNPRPAAVYNIGGGYENSCSVIEAVSLTEAAVGRRMRTTYRDEPRMGDHVWWVTDMTRFQKEYPRWERRKSLRQIIAEIVDAQRELVPDEVDLPKIGEEWPIVSDAEPLVEIGPE